MQVSFIALHEYAAGLLRHAIVIADTVYPADFFQPGTEGLVGNTSILQFLPAAAVDQMTSRKID